LYLFYAGGRFSVAGSFEKTMSRRIPQPRRFKNLQEHGSPQPIPSMVNVFPPNHESKDHLPNIFERYSHFYLLEHFQRPGKYLYQ